MKNLLLHQNRSQNTAARQQADSRGCHRKHFHCKTLLAIGVSLLSAGAVAQTSGSGGGDTLEEVVVTASRIARSGFEAPTPVTVIGSETLERAAVTNVAEYLNELPAIRPSTTPGNTGISTTNAGTFFMNLRGLGNQRTLVLVNKRRHVPTTPEGMVDLNVIPNALIERIEMVTGGASAAWGSDAVAGVVNVIMDEDITGLKSTIQYGESELGDAEDFRFSLAGGIEFAGGRGHAYFGGEYGDNKGMPTGENRDWFQGQHLLIANPDYAAGTDEPQYLVASNVTAANATTGGLITSGPLRGTEFLPGGAVRQFNFGDNLSSAHMTNGDGLYEPSLRVLSTPVERSNLFLGANYEFSDDLSGFVEAGYAHSVTDYKIAFFTARDRGITIQQDNAYLPEVVRQQMIDEAVTSFTMGRYSNDYDYQNTHNGNDMFRLAAGLDGTVFDDWSWSTYVQYGENTSQADIGENRLNDRYNESIDAVLDPVSSNVVCRSTLTDPGNGCVPVNLFGVGSPSQAAADYFLSRRDLDRALTQKAFGFDISGEPFSTSAGPVSVAAGIEHRQDEVEQTVNQEAIDGLFNIGNSKPYAGDYDVTDYFLETIVPVLSGKSYAESLELNAAIRLSDYNLSGQETTWKLGASWEPNQQIRFRFTQSRDIRAPNLAELYTGLSLSFSNLFNPVTGVSEPSVPTPRTGNENLKPEIADTTTFGVVLTPSSIEGARFSIDAYDIQVADVISVVGGQNIVNFCADGLQQFCDVITRGPGGELLEVRNTSVNLAKLETRGVDIEASLVRDMQSGAKMNYRLLATYLDKYESDNGISTIEVSDVVSGGGAGPKWRALASVAYMMGPWDMQLQGRYVHKGIRYPNVTYDDPTVESWSSFNLSGSYSWTDTALGDVQFFAKIANLFDRDPAITPTSSQPTSRTQHDRTGRAYAVGLRIAF